MKVKRTKIRKPTRESKILQYMRTSKRISLRDAGDRCNFSDSLVSHYERGRLDIPRKKLETLVHAYGYTIQEFNEFLNGKEIPILNLKDECADLLDRINEEKLRAVHAVLTSFVA